ncbi:MAG: hypothetical protein ACYDAQ_18940 [Mycobacteriales bacterium]
MLRVLIPLPVLALATVAGVGYLHSEHTVRTLATPACQSVAVSGTLVGDHVFGPVCVPNPYAVTCVSDTSGFAPWADLTVTACAPNPA